ncbi:hypothetical protein Tco_1073823 [Tanacetum coccineum]
MYEIGYKALFDGYEFKTRKSDTKRYDVICRNDDTIKLLGHLLELKLKDNIRIYNGKEIKHDIYTDLNIDITYKQAWRSKNVALESLSGCHVASFAQLPYYCHNLEMINDGAVTHIETDNEDRFKMVFIAFGVLAFAYELQIEGYKASVFILEDVQSYHLNDFIWAINETLEQLS